MEMDEHGGHRDISKSKNVIIESSKVEAVNGSEKLFFQFLTQSGNKGEFSKFSFEDTDNFVGNKLISTSRHNGHITRMGREQEGNGSNGLVVNSGHDKAEVTMGASSACGRDCMCISIDFLCEEAKCRVGW